MSRIIDIQSHDLGKEVSINNFRDIFRELIEKKPTLEEALDQLYKSLGLKNFQIKRNNVIKNCEKVIEKKFDKIKKVQPYITKNEAIIICTYTYEEKGEDPQNTQSPYIILNSNLVENDRKKGIENVSKYFYILLKALRKLTLFNCNNKNLYRILGEKVDTKIKKNNPNYVPYKVGNIKTFWAFTSTSPIITKAIADFLSDGKGKNSKTGTKLTIHGDIVGYDITLFSYYGNENEILLEPERKFRIESVYEINEVVDADCYILKTPLVLEDIIKPKEIKDGSANEITIKVKIQEEDKNKNVYFLDNTKENEIYFENGEIVKFNHDNLKEMDESNTTLIIDGKVTTFNKLFIPEKSGIYTIRLLFKNKLSDCAYMFCNCDKIIDVDFSKFNTQNVTDMKFMFNGCASLALLNLSSFKTENVINMDSMFSWCNSLKSLDLKSFNTNNVSNMSYMFFKCSSLTSIKLSSFNTQNVSNMACMFSGCSSLTALNLSSFNTQNVINMFDMFSECSSLKIIDLSSFKTEKVTYMNGIFSKCASLKTLNLSSFNTQKVRDMRCMFEKCSSLTTLNLSSFKASKVLTNYMFDGCKKLANCVNYDKNIANAFKNKL